VDSLRKRSPAWFTVIMPGFARSNTKCGNTALLPSLRLRIDTGAQNAWLSPPRP